MGVLFPLKLPLALWLASPPS